MYLITLIMYNGALNEKNMSVAYNVLTKEESFDYGKKNFNYPFTQKNRWQKYDEPCILL